MVNKATLEFFAMGVFICFIKELLAKLCFNGLQVKKLTDNKTKVVLPIRIFFQDFMFFNLLFMTSK